MIKQLNQFGLNSDTLYAGALLSVLLSIGVWLFYRTEDRPGAERFGIFVGLWAPTVMVLGKIMQDAEKEMLATEQTPAT